MKSALAYSTVGIQLAVTIFLFVYGGYTLDERYDTSPGFLVLGAFLGMGMGFYNLVRELRYTETLIKKDREDDKRHKWL